MANEFKVKNGLITPTIAFGVQSIATTGGTTTCTVATPFYTIFTGTQGQTMVLPDATTLKAGWKYGIDNSSTQSIEVKTNGGSSFWLIAPGCDLYITCTGIGTAAGTWEKDYAAAKLANGKVLTVSNTLTFTGTDASSVAFGTGGTVLYSGGALGTPTSGVLTNCTGTASSLTAGSVTTNANLTGPITSIGNATSIASQTGTGTKFVMDTRPRLATCMTIDTVPLTRIKFNIAGEVTGGVSSGTQAYGMAVGPVINSDVTVFYKGFNSTYTTEAATFAISNVMQFSAMQGALGAGSSVTNQYGFYTDASLIGATYNFGFYGNIPAATGRYNLYMSGTAVNYLVGSTGIGVAPPATTGDLAVKEQILSTTTYSATTGAGNIALNSATGNRLDFAAIGYAPPAYTTRSTGTKICLWPSVAAASVDYALGIDAGELWTSVPASTESFKWYAGTALAGTLSGTGNFTAVGNVAGVDIKASGSVGVGAVTPSTYDITLGGQVNRYIASERQTIANTVGTHLYLIASSAAVAATDKAGGTLVLRSGLSTGAGTGDVYIQTATNTAASTTDNTYITAFRASNNKIGFYGVTPVVRAAATTAATAVAPAGGTGAAAGGWDTAAHRDTAIAAINNLMTRVAQLETILTNLGLSA